MSPAAAAAREGGLPLRGRPRVLAYTDNTRIGGAEATLATLVGALGDAIEPTLVGTDRTVLGWIAARCPGVPAFLLPHVRDKRDVRRIAVHLRAVRAQRADILHANLHHSWSSQYGLLAGLLAPDVRTVAVEHSLWPPSSPVQPRLRRWLMRHVDAHVAVSERLARMVEELLGRPPGSVETIHNGVADVHPAPCRRLRAEPTLGFVGRMAEEKGADLLLHALTRLPGTVAILVGDGPERPRLEQLSAALDVADRAVFTGWSNEVARILPTFDVLVQPSREEGFGLAAVEAMLARLPVVATDVGGVAEVVADGETGVLVAPEDPSAIAGAAGRLLADPQERRRMGERGRAVALDRFSAEAMARRFASVYAHVLA